jgi:16S rRNA (guanine527-N7)-methyltransferase
VTAALEARLAEICERHGVELEPVSRLARHVAASDAPENIAALALERVIDALSTLRVPAVREARLVADVGTGWGFPGLLLATVLDAEVRLVEAKPERCAYLRDAARALGLTNVTVVESRVESWAERGFDLVTCRAVALLPTIAEWTAPYARIGATVVLWSTELDATESADVAAAAEAMGLAPDGVLLAYTGPEELPGGWRYLRAYRKVKETPAGYPRTRNQAKRKPVRAGAPLPAADGPRSHDPAALDARLDELCARYDVPAAPLRRLADFVAAADIDPKIAAHALEYVIEGLSALEIPAMREARLVGDVGTGFGFPGLVLATLLDADVRLVELQRDRCAYLREAVEALGLARTRVVEGPVEAWGERACDVVTSRNVARLPTIVEWTAPHVRLGGAVVLWTRTRPEREAADGAAAAAALGLEPDGVVETHGWPGQTWSPRYLHVYRKARETPPQYPRGRRAALKDPIRAR